MDRRSAGVTVHPDDHQPQGSPPGSPQTSAPDTPQAAPPADDLGPDETDLARGEDIEEDAPVPNLEHLLADAAALAAQRDPALGPLVNRFWRLVPDEDLVGRTAEQMVAAVSTHVDLAADRLPGQMKMALERNGKCTAVLVATDDMPFLVDSVTAAITLAGLDLNLLAHPQVVVRREAMGRLNHVRAD